MGLLQESLVATAAVIRTLWEGNREGQPDASSQTQLWLNKVALECRRKISVVEHSSNNYVAVATFLNTKPNSDLELIIVRVEDNTIDNLTRKAAPQSSEIPFAAPNG